jgi:hypothetical protein
VHNARAKIVLCKILAEEVILAMHDLIVGMGCGEDVVRLVHHPRDLGPWQDNIWGTREWRWSNEG